MAPNKNKDTYRRNNVSKQDNAVTRRQAKRNEGRNTIPYAKPSSNQKQSQVESQEETELEVVPTVNHDNITPERAAYTASGRLNSAEDATNDCTDGTRSRLVDDIEEGREVSTSSGLEGEEVEATSGLKDSSLVENASSDSAGLAVAPPVAERSSANTSTDRVEPGLGDAHITEHEAEAHAVEVDAAVAQPLDGQHDPAEEEANAHAPASANNSTTASFVKDAQDDATSDPALPPAGDTSAGAASTGTMNAPAWEEGQTSSYSKRGSRMWDVDFLSKDGTVVDQVSGQPTDLAYKMRVKDWLRHTHGIGAKPVLKPKRAAACVAKATYVGKQRTGKQRMISPSADADNTANIEVADPDEAPWDYERMTAAGVLNREDALEFGKAAYLKAYEDVKDHVTNSIANSSAAFIAREISGVSVEDLKRFGRDVVQAGRIEGGSVVPVAGGGVPGESAYERAEDEYYPIFEKISDGAALLATEISSLWKGKRKAIEMFADSPPDEDPRDDFEEEQSPVPQAPPGRAYYDTPKMERRVRQRQQLRDDEARFRREQPKGDHTEHAFGLNNDEDHPYGQIAWVPKLDLSNGTAEDMARKCHSDLQKLGVVRRIPCISLLYAAQFEIIPFKKVQRRFSGLFANIEGCIYTAADAWLAPTRPLTASYAKQFPDDFGRPVYSIAGFGLRDDPFVRKPHLGAWLMVTRRPSVANAARNNVAISKPVPQSTQIHEAAPVGNALPVLSNEEFSFAKHMDTDESMTEAPIAEASYAEVSMEDAFDDHPAPHAASLVPSSKTSVVPLATSPSTSLHVPQVHGSGLPVVSSAATGMPLHHGPRSSPSTGTVGHAAPATSLHVPPAHGNGSLSHVSGGSTFAPPHSIPQNASASNTAGRAVPRPSPWNTTVVQQKRADFIKLQLVKLDAAEQGLVNNPDPFQTVWDEYRKRIKGALLKLVGDGGKDGKQAATQWLNGADATGKFPTRREHWGGWIKDDFGRRMNL